MGRSDIYFIHQYCPNTGIFAQRILLKSERSKYTRYEWCPAGGLSRGDVVGRDASLDDQMKYY